MGRAGECHTGKRGEIGWERNRGDEEKGEERDSDGENGKEAKR